MSTKAIVYAWSKCTLWVQFRKGQRSTISVSASKCILKQIHYNNTIQYTGCHTALYCNVCKSGVHTLYSIDLSFCGAFKTASVFMYSKWIGLHGKTPWINFLWLKLGFNLMKRSRRGRKIIAQQAIIKDSGQHGGSVTHCTAINNCGVLHCHATLGPQ